MTNVRLRVGDQERMPWIGWRVNDAAPKEPGGEQMRGIVVRAMILIGLVILLFASWPAPVEASFNCWRCEDEDTCLTEWEDGWDGCYVTEDGCFEFGWYCSIT
jgi:hypothetical protein